MPNVHVITRGALGETLTGNAKLPAGPLPDSPSNPASGIAPRQSRYANRAKFSSERTCVSVRSHGGIRRGTPPRGASPCRRTARARRMRCTRKTSPASPNRRAMVADISSGNRMTPAGPAASGAGAPARRTALSPITKLAARESQMSRGATPDTMTPPDGQRKAHATPEAASAATGPSLARHAGERQKPGAHDRERARRDQRALGRGAGAAAAHGGRDAEPGAGREPQRVPEDIRAHPRPQHREQQHRGGWDDPPAPDRGGPGRAPPRPQSGEDADRRERCGRRADRNVLRRFHRGGEEVRRRTGDEDERERDARPELRRDQWQQERDRDGVAGDVRQIDVERERRQRSPE